MPDISLIDHSPNQPIPITKLSTANNLVLIDNYDSFTWNVYQYLILEGADVKVFRNDKIDLKELIRINPTQLVISPGPGHPDTDAGISQEAIQYFAGKIPILGVCMGQQCIISTFGGKVDVTGEILHGKTSPLRHDNKGVYKGLTQDLPVTRYHSLAGTHPTLPESLEVSSWIAKGPDGGKGVIMGVRHKKFVIEGVQFHPESILTENGRLMIKNFLTMTGGEWNKTEQTNPTTILDKIYSARRKAVNEQKLLPSQRFEDLQASYNLGLSPPQISFPDRIRKSKFSLALMAEIKRASPSKGIISLSTCAPAQARKYALSGASVISVLTEPEWFKGGLEDLRSVRQSLESIPNRPAVLRKEFIFDEYQILEARLAGADTVLLIVKMLNEETLTRLYKYSKSLGMEPLVEVNTAEEMKIAIELGSEVIGINNRDLTTFDVDLQTTNRLMDGVPKSTILCALSGISTSKDVSTYKSQGVHAILVGEALMRAKDTSQFIQELLGQSEKKPESPKMMIKICGTRTPEAAKIAIESGADFIGIILVPGRKRFINNDIALQISKVVKNTPKKERSKSTIEEIDYFDHQSKILARSDRALLVGVFVDATLDHIINQVYELELDIVQLHGKEPLEFTRNIPVPVFKKFDPNDINLHIRGYHSLPLLDSGAGTGQKLDSNDIKQTFQHDNNIKVILAGGLNEENIKSVLNDLGSYKNNICAVDISSGVETDGKQDHTKITNFINIVKSI